MREGWKRKVPQPTEPSVIVKVPEVPPLKLIRYDEAPRTLCVFCTKIDDSVGGAGKVPIPVDVPVDVVVPVVVDDPPVVV